LQLSPEAAQQPYIIFGSDLYLNKNEHPKTIHRRGTLDKAAYFEAHSSYY
jgi:hypothetical protein